MLVDGYIMVRLHILKYHFQLKWFYDNNSHGLFSHGLKNHEGFVGTQLQTIRTTRTTTTIKEEKCVDLETSRTTSTWI